MSDQPSNFNREPFSMEDHMRSYHNSVTTMFEGHVQSLTALGLPRDMAEREIGKAYGRSMASATHLHP